MLTRDLGVPVVPTVAPRGEGLEELEAAVLRVSAGGGLGETAGTPLPRTSSSASGRSPSTSPRGRRMVCTRPAGSALAPRPSPSSRATPDVARSVGLGAGGFLTDADEGLALEIAKARHAEARALAAAAQDTRAAADRWWRLTTAPRTGIPIMLGVITAVFATLFIVGDLLARVLTAAWTAWISPAVISVVTAIFGDGTVGKVVLWGVDGGILATLAVGIPYILTFYFILALVEDSGYMNAAAFLADRVMHLFGLHGRAVIPLMAAAGCNVPAIIATRSLGNKRERTIAAVLATLTPCSARTAVIIGAVAGVAGWQYALLTYGVIIVVIILAGLGLNRLMPGDKGVLVMEMFPFRRPVLRQVARKTWRRFREFVWDAAPIILLGSMALGLLYETGWVWNLGTVLKPIVEGWLLLPMVAGLTLIFAVLRKELALQLLLVFAAVQAGGAVANISSFMTTSQIVTYAIVNALYIPCVATIAVLGRELGWRRTAVICAGTIGIALSSAASSPACCRCSPEPTGPAPSCRRRSSRRAAATHGRRRRAGGSICAEGSW